MKEESSTPLKLMLYVLALTFIGGLVGGLAPIAGELYSELILDYFINDLGFVKSENAIYLVIVIFGAPIGIIVGFFSKIENGLRNSSIVLLLFAVNTIVDLLFGDFDYYKFWFGLSIAAVISIFIYGCCLIRKHTYKTTANATLQDDR